VEQKEKKKEQWFQTGFQPPPEATPKQRWFIFKSWDKMCVYLLEEEKVAIEFMGQEDWLNCLDKERAGELISLMLNGKKPQKRVDNTKVKKLSVGAMISYAKAICSNCDSVMKKENLGLKCRVCGARIFHVRRGVW